MLTNDRTGFALATVIFALVITSIMATGGLYMSSQERRVAQAGRNADEALYVAENGLARVLEEWDAAAMGALDPWEADTLTGTETGQGAWEVSVLRLSDRMFFLESHGQVERGGEIPPGVGRHVGLLAARPTIDLDPPAALTTRGPTDIRGTAEVHGEDEVPPDWTSVCTGSLTDKPGVVTDDASQVGTGGQGEITGTPAVQADTTISDSTFTTFGDITWDELVELATVTVGPGTINNTFPDSTSNGTCVTSTSTNWGNPENPDGACGDHFPIIHAQGDHLRIQSGGVGQGILLVDGDLDLRGSFLFHGIVIVQGNFETQGSGNRVRGGVMAANTYFEDQSLVGGSVVGYSSCAVERAIELNSALSRPQVLTNRAWSDLSRAGS